MIYGSDETFPAYVKYLTVTLEQEGENPFEIGIFLGVNGEIVKRTSHIYFMTKSILDETVECLISAGIHKARIELTLNGNILSLPSDKDINLVIHWGE